MIAATLKIDPSSGLLRLQKKIPYVALVVQDALNEYAQNVYDTSQELVPVDTGFLQYSGYVETQSDVVGDLTTIEIGYDAPYALYVHENLELQHPNGGMAKYLELPMELMLPDLQRNIIERVGALVYSGYQESEKQTYSSSITADEIMGNYQ